MSLCGPCNSRKKEVSAVVFCIDCENEYLCIDCKHDHTFLRATKKHVLKDIDISFNSSDEDREFYCDVCKFKEKKSTASAFCPECKNEILCVSCKETHMVQTMTRMHELKDISCFRSLAEGSSSICIKTMPASDAKRKPGRPTIESTGFESIKLHWTKPEQFDGDDYFEISFTDNIRKEWTTLEGKVKEELYTLCDLKSETQYLFRVRVISNHWAGPYSDESESVKTAKSAASQLAKGSTFLSVANSVLNKFILPMKQKARDSQAKIRTLKHGTRKNNRSSTEKTIMLIGETGTGKSTMVDALANYILGVKWEDTFRIEMVNLESDEQQNSSNRSMSQTEWITCYVIRPLNGGRLDYSITIIDTPGFGGTRGTTRDDEIVHQISTLFESKPPNGVLHIDAICFIIKASECRLTPTQKYIFDAILSLFGKDIEQNICPMITFATGDDPPVVQVLKESEIPFEQQFMFNNMGMFSKKTSADELILSHTSWKRGIQNFRNFFTFLESLHTKSLQLTYEVIQERVRLETTVYNFEVMIDRATKMINNLSEEMESLKAYQEDIKNNANYKIKIKELETVKENLPYGQHTTTCTTCEFTCHLVCSRAENRKKDGCMVMKKGICTMCPKKCIWSNHINTPYRFRQVTVEKEKTFDEIKKKYEKASGEAMNKETIIKQIRDDVAVLYEQMEEKMDIVVRCNERLAEIALRPKPYTRVDHINMMIKNAEREKKPGYIEKIRILNKLKNRNIEKDYQKVKSRRSKIEETHPL